mmetsp:Transcript_12015/g.30317  ORF Transcript_12015/g.30317 Transcript_12015/m.30317 type:complete len:81 (-) Transcript_12015:3141-3383(-)
MDDAAIFFAFFFRDNDGKHNPDLNSKPRFLSYLLFFFRDNDVLLVVPFPLTLRRVSTSHIILIKATVNFSWNENRTISTS